jgi:hypothetical protein
VVEGAYSISVNPKFQLESNTTIYIQVKFNIQTIAENNCSVHFVGKIKAFAFGKVQPVVELLTFITYPMVQVSQNEICFYPNHLSAFHSINLQNMSPIKAEYSWELCEDALLWERIDESDSGTLTVMDELLSANRIGATRLAEQIQCQNEESATSSASSEVTSSSVEEPLMQLHENTTALRAVSVCSKKESIKISMKSESRSSMDNAKNETMNELAEIGDAIQADPTSLEYSDFLKLKKNVHGCGLPIGSLIQIDQNAGCLEPFEKRTVSVGVVEDSRSKYFYITVVTDIFFTDPNLQNRQSSQRFF